MKFNIDTRQKFFTVVLIGVAGVFLLVMFVIAPLFQKMAGHKRDIGEVSEHFKKGEMLLKSNIEGQTFLRFADGKNVSVVIHKITQAGVKNRIKFISISPLEVEKSAEFEMDVLPIRMELTAEYTDVGLFLEEVLNTLRDVFVVREFKIERDEAILPQVHVKLLLDVYLENER